jgi:hypothetical protein
MIFLADLNVKLGTEDIFKPTTGKESLNEINNYNGVRVVNFTTFKSLPKVQRSHIVTFINLLGPLPTGRPTIKLTIF